MKIFILIFALLLQQTVFAFSSLSQQAEYYQNLFNNPADSTTISKSEMNKGETRPKAVLKGAFYFGGSDQKREKLSSKFQEKLCTEGFSKAYSVYTKINKSFDCSSNSLEYTYIGMAKTESDKVRELMLKIYEIIKANGNRGPVYLHCYYGVHASNTYAQMVLKQFCNISDEKALENWDKVDLYDSLDEENRQKQLSIVRNFRPFSDLVISESERSVICY